MDESAKRKERLLALRMEASAACGSPATPPLPPPQAPVAPLPNPLLPAPPASEMSPRTPRFDYYTNPAAAFSGSKRKSGYYNSSASTTPPTRPSTGPRNYSMDTSHQPVNQFHTAPFPNCGPADTMPHAPMSSTPWRSPVQFQSPFAGQHDAPAPSGPGSWNAYSPSHSLYPGSPRGGFTSPYFVRGSPATNPGSRGSPYSHSGRGGHSHSQHYRSSPGPRGSGGRGRGFYNHEGRNEPDHYYMKSMVEDPWRELKPIVGSLLKPGQSSWTSAPKSSSANKTVSVQIGAKTNSGLSLAEYLDSAFNETIDET